MKVLILQHEQSTPPGSTLEWCESRRHSYEVRWAQEPLPALDQFDMLILCGGSMDVDQEDRHPWLVAEKEFVRKALQENKKLVGLCLGGQLLAESLGGKVGKHPHWEVGWQEVQFKDGQRLKVFQWHGYSFSLPPGVEHLASNEACEYQAFSRGHQVLACQFHPETTREWAIECSESPNLPTTGYVQTREEIQRDLKYQQDLQAWYFNQLDRLAKSQ